MHILADMTHRKRSSNSWLKWVKSSAGPARGWAEKQGCSYRYAQSITCVTVCHKVAYPVLSCEDNYLFYYQSIVNSGKPSQKPVPLILSISASMIW